MKKIFLQLFILLSPFYACAQANSSDYESAANRFQQYYNHEQADSLYAIFAPVMQNAAPIDKTRTLITQLKGSLGDIKNMQLLQIAGSAAAYKVTFDNAVLTLTLSLNENKQIQGFFFHQYTDENASATPDNKTQKDVQLKIANGMIHGSLVMPEEQSKKVPVVLIIAGSGPTDRDGNSALGEKACSYKMLADSLAAHGIASVRYDKRGVGKSNVMEKEEDARFEDMISDAAGFIKMLKEDQRFSKVIVLGHSEGSLIGMVAAKKTNADAFISLSGAGYPAYKIIAAQLQAQPGSYTELALKDLDTLKNGKTTSAIPSELSDMLRPSVQPYLISWFKYDPQSEIKKLKVPILILQGTTDIQVSIQDAKALKNAQPKAELKLIDGMNHVLKTAPADRAENEATYLDSTLPIKQELVMDIVQFIKS